MKNIGVLTSGGDSPGMNSAIRAVARTCAHYDIKCTGIVRGFQGLIENNTKVLYTRSVRGIINRGGTFLYSARSDEFKTKEGRKEAFKTIEENEIDGLVVIGGDGSFTGGLIFMEEYNIPVVGIPGTIDNDLYGTSHTLGYDTALNTATEAIDKIRDTASSHERTFIVEVMGRKSPSIAVHVGVCCGAENIIFPYKKVDYDRIAQDIKHGIKKGKTSSIIIVGEGEKPGMSYNVQRELRENHQLVAHVCILGHIQRGGAPTHQDRFIASKMGNMAVSHLMTSSKAAAICYENGGIKVKSLKKKILKMKLQNIKLV